MMRYFKKEIPLNPLRLPNGRTVEFEYGDPNDFGFLKTEDGFTIAELDKAIAARRGGVLNSNETEYGEFQKKNNDTQLANWQPGQQQVLSAQTLGMATIQAFRRGQRGEPGSAAAHAATGSQMRQAPGPPNGARPPQPPKAPAEPPAPLEVPSNFPTVGRVIPKPPAPAS